MYFRSTAVRATIAGLAVLALATSATPAFADAVKPAPTATGSVSPHGAATPLENDAEQTVSGTEIYVYDTGFIYWSAVGLRSEGGKPSLSLYADEAGETLLAKSAQKRKKTEFVVVDSNHALVPSTYYPVARSKSGESSIELDNDAIILFDDDPLSLPMTESDVIRSTDVYLTAGVEYVLIVKGEGDAGLYLMQSNVDEPSTWYQSRADAVGSSDKKGAGKAEKITFTGTDDWYSVIVLNNSGSGTYTLLKSAA